MILFILRLVITFPAPAVKKIFGFFTSNISTAEIKNQIGTGGSESKCFELKI
jgi:hypothetical protein